MRKHRDETETSALNFKLVAHSARDKVDKFPAIISYTVVGEYKNKLESMSFENQFYNSFSNLVKEMKSLAEKGLRTKNNKFIWKIVEQFNK